MYDVSKRLLVPLVTVLPLTLALGCSDGARVPLRRAAETPRSKNTFPVTVQTASGAVEVPAKPEAIVSLSPTATEMLYAIGAGDQVKAVDEDSDYPPDAPVTKLDGVDPNVEAIAGYKPDLVVVAEDPPAFSSQMKALGVAVLDEPAAEDLVQEYQEFVEVGQATGNLAAAEAEVVKIRSQIATIVADTPRPVHPETYYYEIDPTYYSATSSTFIGQLLGLLGLKSIADAAKGAATSGGYPQLSGEFILAANPDYIFLADTICCDQSVATLANRPGWSSLSAVTDGRVLGLNDDIASRWGPRIVLLLQAVAAALKQHPVGTTP